MPPQEQDWFATTDADWFASQGESTLPPQPEPGAAAPWHAIRGDTPRMSGTLTDVALLAAGGPVLRMASKLPVGRLMSAGLSAVKGGASRLPIVGPVAKGAMKGAQQSWKASTPVPPPMAAPPAAAQMAGPMPKPKLSAAEVPQMLRQQFGSEKASRMLYGKSGVGLPRQEAIANIKRLAPGDSTLPQNAQRAISKGVQQGSPQEAWSYLQKGNTRARDYIISLLRGTP